MVGGRGSGPLLLWAGVAHARSWCGRAWLTPALWWQSVTTIRGRGPRPPTIIRGREPRPPTIQRWTANAPAFSEPLTTHDQRPMTRILQGVLNFQKRIFGSKQELFEQLAKGQKPLALFIT